jgi:tRNA threonylcarbamoyladenosine biosynthesis protein TsaE
MSRSDTDTLTSECPEETHRLGVKLGELLQPGDVVGLVGELGAGKTCLVAGVAEGMGVGDEIYVSSPTFTLVNEYPGRFAMVHIDYYRLTEEEDLLEVGVDEYFRGESACLVEWFDRFPGAAPPDHLVVRFAVTGPTGRRLELDPQGERPRALARAWARSTANA